MGALYAAVGNCTTGTDKTALSLTSDGNTRGFVHYVAIGISATPADNASTWALQRVTAAGTSTSVTPSKLDGAEGAARVAAGSNHSAEPTYTSSTRVAEWPINQRQTFQWWANKGPLVIPATSANGFGLKTTASGASLAASVTMHWEE